MRQTIWLAAILLSLSASCNRTVERNEIIGTWVVTNDSRQRLLPAAQQKGSAKIVLDANGSFVASEIPEDLLYGPPEVADRLVTGSGDWKLASREGRQQVQLNFNVIATGQRGRVPYGTQLNVSKRGSLVSLFYFQGDPDQGRKVEFERK
jgi:hypothetical protein